MRKLSEVCEKPEYGYTTSARPSGSGPLFVRTTDISDGVIRWESVPFCAVPPTDEERYCLRDGDILVARAGSVGASVVVKNPPRAIFASYLIRFRPKKQLNPDYAGFYFQSSGFWAQLGSKTAGTTLPGVNAANLAKLEIPLPLLEIQDRIVAILRQAEETRRIRVEADETTNQLLGSLFFELFGDPMRNPKGWPVAKLGDMLSEDPQNGLYKPSKEYGKGTPILRIDSFYSGKIDNIEQLKHVKCSENEIEKFKVRISDILINRVNSLEYLGKCGLVRTLIEDTVYESNMMRIKPRDDQLDPTFLTMLLCTSYVKQQILKRAKKAVNQASINQEDVKSLSIVLPPIALQRRFSEAAREIEEILEKQTGARAETMNLFNALMQMAFKGDLTK